MGKVSLRFAVDSKNAGKGVVFFEIDTSIEVIS